MRAKILSILIIVVVVVGFASAYDHRMQFDQQPLGVGSSGEGEGKVVDLKADVVYPITIDGDSTVYCLVGNFVAHHNGAVIVCDSAVRYNDKRIECFGNVLINQGATYIYGDRAEYNGEINEAEVHSELVKVVDGDVTLYTYKFKFNTLESIGTYSEGGVVTKEDNMLESDRGYFYANDDQIICVDNVQLTNEQYQMMGDSVIYNLETDCAQFFTNTNIWNDKGEYIFADRGSYEKADEKYVITKNGYILTEKEEVWSDSLDYYREKGYGLLRHNVQLDDQSHKMVAFGDRGEYWKETGSAVLTLDPSAISYDKEQGDSVFMRADTMVLYSRSTQGDKQEAQRKEQEAKEAAEKARIADSVKRAEAAAKVEGAQEGGAAEKQTDAVGEQAKERLKGREKREKDKEKPSGERAPHAGSAPAGYAPAGEAPTRKLDKASDRLPSSSKLGGLAAQGSDSLAQGAPAKMGASMVADSLAKERGAQDSLVQDSLQRDSLAKDTLKVMSAADSLAARLDTLPKAERKALLKEIALKEREAVRAEKRRLADSVKREQLKIQKAKLDSIGEVRQQKKNAMLDRMKAREDTLMARAKAREEARKLKMIARLTRKGVKFKWADSLSVMRADSTLRADLYLYDSLVNRLFDSLFATPADTLGRSAAVVDTAVVDTQYRLVLGYRNVRIYRSDFQGVCDSLSMSTLDSILHMYISPILWQGLNQVTSEAVDMHTSNQQLVRAEFMGKPMMVSKIDTLHYNQVAGKTMTSYFRNNAVYRNNVDGNAQTIYYMQEDGSPDVVGLMYIESANMSFFIEDQMVSGITYRGSPTYTIYPMDKIPETQPLFLQGFAWHEDKRPARDSVFNRVLRPSLRTEKEALARPSFPISKRIDGYRECLIKRNEWSDRNDILTQDVIDWLETQTEWKELSEKNRRQREEFGQ